jgi:Zn-dependent protease with chaperone function
MPESWAELLAQSIVHALVAALVVEALVRVWRVQRPDERLALRLAALVQPLAVTPALVFLSPVRAGEEFRDRWAIFSGRHWEGIQLLGRSVFDIFVLAMAGLGLGLFLMDLLPLLRRVARRGSREARPPPAELAAEVVQLARAAGARPPPVCLLAADVPAVYCTGVRRPRVMISRGALDLLDPAERRAALAHEVFHLARRDPLVSWLLMGARALLLFNPVAQVLARVMAREAERRADDGSVGVTGDPLALASALLKLHRATGGGPAVPRTLPFGSALSEPLRRARSRDVEIRCRRLIDGGPGSALPLSGLRVALVALSLPALLFFVA